MTVLTAALRAEDTRLPPAVGAGSVDAALLLQHEPQLRRLVHRLLGWSAQQDAVDDLVQEVFLAAWNGRDRFRGEAALSTWLTRIAIRKTQLHARWAMVRRRWFGRLLPLRDTPATVTACPLEHREELTAMRAAMADLRHRDREILVLHYLEGRPVEALCQLLSLTRAAADARLSRARQRLRAALGTDPGEDA